MKKQYLISLFITCAVIFNVNAQNTPIDDFLKKYPSRKDGAGVTNVLMSQQMLRSFFASQQGLIIPNSQSSGPRTLRWEGNTNERSNDDVVRVLVHGRIKEIKVPEAYSSVNVSRPGVPEIWFTDFKKMLMSSRYEPILEMRVENNNLGYYVKKLNDNSNEIIVLRQRDVQFSAIYLKGDIEIDMIDTYLSIIRNGLNQRLGAMNDGKGFIQSNNLLTLTASDGNNSHFFEMFINEFDSEVSRRRVEESMQRTKDLLESEEFKLKMEESMQQLKDIFDSEDLQRKINDAIR